MNSKFHINHNLRHYTRALFLVLLALGCSQLFAKEHEYPGAGTVLITTVNDDHVNVRKFPSTRFEVVRQLDKGSSVIVTGMSETPERIGTDIAYWFRVRDIANLENFFAEDLGWVFGKYLDDVATLKPTQFSLNYLENSSGDTAPALHLFATRGASPTQVTVYPKKNGSQPFYTFVWSSLNQEFRYDDVPGTWIWHPETNKIKHVAWLGRIGDTAFSIVTTDFKYLFQDVPISAFPRRFVIWNLEKYTPVGDVLYDNDQPLAFTRHTIKLLYVYGSDPVSNKSLDAETLKFADQWKIDHPQPKPGPVVEEGDEKVLVINYSKNLDTGERKFLDCEWKQIR